MSRTIDTSKPEKLTDDDIRYLAQRDQLPQTIQDELGEARIRKLLSPETLSLEDRAHTGDANTDGISKEEHERVVQKLADTEAELAAEREKTMAANASEAIIGNYENEDGWTNETRRNEIEKRGMDPAGLKKAGQLRVLKASDAAGGGEVLFTIDENGDLEIDGEDEDEES